MLNKENIDLCWQVLTKYGVGHQMMKLGEECTELAQVIFKIAEGDESDENKKHFLEEFIDVFAVWEQMRLELQIPIEYINTEIKFKLERALYGKDKNSTDK